MKEKYKPIAKYSLDATCPFPFDKNMFMPPFPKGLEVPKYDKYLDTFDPHDQIRELCALSMKFMHDQSYLMHLFLQSLGGEAMKWFSRLPNGIKSFDELVKIFLQHTTLSNDNGCF